MRWLIPVRGFSFLALGDAGGEVGDVGVHEEHVDAGRRQRRRGSPP